MYYYIFDSYTLKYQKDVDRIHLRLADLGIDGEKAQVTPIRRVEDLAKTAISSGAENIIAVGNDATAHQALNIIANLDPKLNFGFIPLGLSRIAQVLGMPEAEEACSVISRRRIERVDLGKVGKEYFLTSFEIRNVGEKRGFLEKLADKFSKAPTLRCEFKCNDDYKVTTEIINLAVINILDRETKERFGQRGGINFEKINPHDGTLNVIVWSEIKEKVKAITRFPLALSFFPAKEIEILEKSAAKILIDGLGVEKVPSKITIEPKKLKVIVGTKRTF